MTDKPVEEMSETELELYLAKLKRNIADFEKRVGEILSATWEKDIEMTKSQAKQYEKLCKRLNKFDDMEDEAEGLLCALRRQGLEYSGGIHAR